MASWAVPVVFASSAGVMAGEVARNPGLSGLAVCGFQRLDLPVIGQVTEAPAALPANPGPTSRVSRYDAAFIDGLPIIGHDYQDVLTLAPGVDDTDGDGSPNIHGARQTGVEYRLDRGDTRDPLTGEAGMNLSPLAIESVEVATAGAPAQFGRADGGFAGIHTRTGSNDLDGRLVFYWRGRSLDRDGANNDDVISFEEKPVAWNDFRLAGALGGPIVTDKIWYFGNLEGIDGERPTRQTGSDSLITMRGVYYLGKLTWRPAAPHRLGLQTAADPRETRGLGLTVTTSDRSGYRMSQSARATELSWDATLSDSLTLESSAARLDSEVSIDPESRFFRPTQVAFVASPSSPGGFQALYPCDVVNCSPALGETSIYQFSYSTGRTNGPFFQKAEQDKSRSALRSSLSWSLSAGPGDHQLRVGFEVGEERTDEDSFTNPVLFDLTAQRFGAPSGSNQVTGIQVLQVFTGQPGPRSVKSVAAGLHVADSWKPWPNVRVDVGVRFDKESADAGGFRTFNPLAERRQSIFLWREVCAEAARQGTYFAPSNCNPLNDYDGNPPSQILSTLASFVDQDMDGVNDVRADVAALDLNQDGFIDFNGAEGLGLFKHFTTLAGRESENFQIDDSHVSPRVGVSWDPWSDGKTRVFAHWGRYYDRIQPDTLLADSGAAATSFVFVPDPMLRMILPGALSASSTRASISQVDRGLRAPRTDELALGFDRELGASWSAGVTYIRRRAHDLLQDTDLNHYTCSQAGEAIGIDPLVICGDAGRLRNDRFGTMFFGSGGQFSLPNGVEDLYTGSEAFAQIFRVENLESSDYAAYELALRRPLREGWQLEASYTWSRARGRAEDAQSQVGDDPSNRSAENGYLSYDQRHRIKVQAVTHLPRGFTLGGIVKWSSGAPYSVYRTEPGDFDISGNVLVRRLLPTGRRNDRRNESIWRFDARVEKSFDLGAVQAGGFLIVENLLDSDDAVITSVEDDGTNLAGERDFGRRFELGVGLAF